jgi:hypothetical protein
LQQEKLPNAIFPSVTGQQQAARFQQSFPLLIFPPKPSGCIRKKSGSASVATFLT